MSYINSSKKNKIALIDCNSFYVSCERLFNPKLNRKPVIVLSNNDGCVISRSSEAKKIGIKMGEPYFKVKELTKKKNVHIFSSNYALYGDISRRVMKTLKSFSDKIEIYSIDEAFVDLSHIEEKELEKYGKEIRERILKWTGIPTSVGISNTKTLSKVANHIAKKNKTGVIYLKENVDESLKNFEISDIWGVGKQLSKLYVKNGIDTAYKLKNISNSWVKKKTNVLGAKTVMELRGVSCIDLETQETKRKSCCVSRSFGKKVESLNKLQESITTHCLNAAEKIRNDDQVAKSLTVFIRTSPFDKYRKYYSNSIIIDLPVATSNSLELIKTAINGLEKIYKYGYFYQKAGIILSKLKESSENELNLLAPIMESKSQKLMKAIDITNAKYGRNAVSIAQAGINKSWKMRREHSSKIDTASFDFLPKISV
ncbi:Y-family DNA polymerase [Pelagibacteraceae bacterium]|jgi:DNA polymerase V|nr:Y-family DNA polymerase [Pelagibacteraceae bacterium]